LKLPAAEALGHSGIHRHSALHLKFAVTSREPLGGRPSQPDTGAPVPRRADTSMVLVTTATAGADRTRRSVAIRILSKCRHVCTELNALVLNSAETQCSLGSANIGEALQQIAQGLIPKIQPNKLVDPSHSRSHLCHKPMGMSRFKIAAIRALKSNRMCRSPQSTRTGPKSLHPAGELFQTSLP